MSGLKSFEDFGNINVRRYETFYKFNLKIPVINTLTNLEIKSTRLKNLVKEKNIKIVHGHNPIILSTAALKYAKKYNLPFVYEAHLFGSDAPIIQKSRNIANFFHLLNQKVLIFKEKKIYRSADVIIIQTTNIKQRIIKMFKVDPDKIKIILVGVDEIKFDPVKWHQKGKELRRAKNWDDKIILMYSGYLRDYNGIKFFLNSIKELPKNIKQKIKIVVLGRGPLQAYVESLSNKHRDLIEFLGLIDYNDMPIYYSACDVNVSPRPPTFHVKDSVPQKLVEVMAMEKIVLGNNTPAIKR